MRPQKGSRREPVMEIVFLLNKSVSGYLSCYCTIVLQMLPLETLGKGYKGSLCIS